MASIDSSDPILTIGNASKKLGISSSTLRLYEDEGLLVKSVTPTGRRLYSLNDLKIVECTRTLVQGHGLNFAGVRALFSRIPCWLVRGCPDAQRKQCGRSRTSLIPCWHSPDTGCRAAGEDCKRCPVYELASTAARAGWLNDLPRVTADSEA